MKFKFIILSLVLFILLAACSNQTSTPVPDKSPGEEKTAADEKTVSEIEKNQNVEYFVHLTDDKYRGFKKAFEGNDFTYDPFSANEANQLSFSIDTFFPEHDFFISDSYKMTNDEYQSTLLSGKSDFVFSKQPNSNAKPLSSKEKQFLDALLAIRLGQCSLETNETEFSSGAFDPTEENFKEAKEAIELYGSTEGYVTSTLEASHYCHSQLFTLNETTGEYVFDSLSQEEITEGIQSVKSFLEKEEDLVQEIEIQNNEAIYANPAFGTIIRIDEQLKTNLKKQGYIEQTKKDFHDLIDFVEKYREWAEEETPSDSLTADESFQSDYTARYDAILEDLKKEEKYLLDIVKKTKEAGLKLTAD